MKTTYTNEQLQEAVDRAFRKSSKGHLTTLKYTEDEIWEDQTKTRLVIARAFLDNLLEQTELTKLRAACDRMSKQEVLSLPQLRPLSEAGPVPEGCQRYYFISTLSTGGRVKIQGDTHFADIRLPAPAEEADPYAELKKAHAAGKIIEQIGHGSSDWFGCGSSIAWSRPPECYRIKPEPMLTKPISLPLAKSMSLRDYFAGQALNGYLASWSDDSDSIFFEPCHTAKTSYAYADAMLAAREVKP